MIPQTQKPLNYDEMLIAFMRVVTQSYVTPASLMANNSAEIKGLDGEVLRLTGCNGLLILYHLDKNQSTITRTNYNPYVVNMQHVISKNIARFLGVEVADL